MHRVPTFYQQGENRPPRGSILRISRLFRLHTNVIMTTTTTVTASMSLSSLGCLVRASDFCAPPSDPAESSPVAVQFHVVTTTTVPSSSLPLPSSSLPPLLLLVQPAAKASLAVASHASVIADGHRVVWLQLDGSATAVAVRWYHHDDDDDNDDDDHDEKKVRKAATAATAATTATATAAEAALPIVYLSPIVAANLGIVVDTTMEHAYFDHDNDHDNHHRHSDTTTATTAATPTTTTAAAATKTTTTTILPRFTGTLWAHRPRQPSDLYATSRSAVEPANHVTLCCWQYHRRRDHGRRRGDDWIDASGPTQTVPVSSSSLSSSVSSWTNRMAPPDWPLPPSGTLLQRGTLLAVSSVPNVKQHHHHHHQKRSAAESEAAVDGNNDNEFDDDDDDDGTVVVVTT